MTSPSDYGFPETEQLAAWKHIPKEQLFYYELRHYEILSSYLKERFKCSDIKVWILLEAKDDKDNK